MEYKPFLEIIEDLGYDHHQPLYPLADFMESDGMYDCGNGCLLQITTFIKPWWNKLNYLHGQYVAFTQDRPVENNEILEELIDCGAQAVDMETYSNVVEVGWRVMYNKHPSEYPREGRRVAIFEFMQRTRSHLDNGMFGMQPFPGIVLAARPLGPKLDKGFTEESIKEGTLARLHFAQRFGFGDMKSDGMCYCYYDDDLKRQPI